MDTRSEFDRLKRASSKHDSYFQAYDRLLAPYVAGGNACLTLVEIGVQNGGSLHLWRQILGERARIIGIDLNPETRILEADGFEIFIGSQSDPTFWADFFGRIGPVDIVIDDGGHTDYQQLVTFFCCLDSIRDGGLLVTEDVHTSYMPMFGNPSNYSFVSFAKRVVDAIMSRSGMIGVSVGPRIHQQVYSVDFYESIIAFHIDRRKCFPSRPVTASGQSFTSAEFRYQDNSINKLNVLEEIAKYFSIVKQQETKNDGA